jgi:hypothetical protein
MADLSASADRVRQIAETLQGRVLGREGEIMRVEIPADLASGAATLFGMAGLTAVIVGQEVRMAPKRVTTTQYQTIVTDEQITQAFYTFKVELTPHAVIAARSGMYTPRPCDNSDALIRDAAQPAKSLHARACPRRINSDSRQHEPAASHLMKIPLPRRYTVSKIATK